MKRLALPRLTLSTLALLLMFLLIPSVVMIWYVKGNMERMLREEISVKVVQNLQKSEGEISRLFSRMANISTVFYLNSGLNSAFSDEATSYYQRYVAFNDVIAGIFMQNLYNYTVEDSVSAIDHFKITMLDERGDIYAGWSMSFRDYSYIFEQDWLKDERAMQGFMLWNMSALGYSPDGEGAQNDQIALSRSIKAAGDGDRRIGTLLITLNRSHLADILSEYKYDVGDVVFASSPAGNVLFYQGGEEAAVSEITERYSRSSKGTGVVTLGGSRYLLTYYTINQVSMVNRARLKIFYLTDYQHLDAQMAVLVRNMNITCAAFAAAGLLLSALIAARIARPVSDIAGQMAAYRAGDVPKRARIRKDEIGDIQLAYYDMSVKINELLDHVRLEQETREKYHYESLRAKMSPHFLFNTLNAIRWMAIIRKADNITSSIDALASILRYSLTNDDSLVKLAEELSIVRCYCEIHNLRTGNRDSLIINVPDELAQKYVIKFILQPAVENCFKHAFSGEHKGEIEISGRMEAGVLRVDVADDGPGFSKESLEKFANRKSASVSGGLGLSIIDERIRMTCGPGYGITPQNDPGSGARLIYRLRSDLIAEEENK